MIHWRAPTIIVGTLVIGILLAVGHHLFYQSSDGTRVPTADEFRVYGLRGVAPQKFNISVGTAFARLVNASLTLSVTTALVQVLWRSMKSRSAKLSSVDAAFSVTKSPLALSHWPIWKRFTLAASLAILLWLMPIASIITPSTLSVAIAAHSTSSPRNVSNVDFTSLNFANLPNTNALSSAFRYAGPQFAVSRVATATAAQGAVLPIAAPDSAPNASYTQTFVGPVIRCAGVTGALWDSITANIVSTRNHSHEKGNLQSYGYIAWTLESNDNRPFVYRTSSAYALRPATLGPFSTGPATVFVASLPAMSNVLMMSGPLSDSAIIENATITQCQLFNETYELALRWVNGAQTIIVTHSASYGGVVAHDTLAAGAASLAATYPNGTYMVPDPSEPWSYNVSMVQTMAYQSVMDAFGQILVGTISNSLNTNGALQTINTSIMSTVLSDAKELAFLREYGNGEADSGINTFQNEAGMNSIKWDGVSVSENITSGTLNLSSALEELFQNITISLMSSALLQAAPTTPYAPAPVDVSFTTYQSIYVYSPLTLWLAYGIVMLFAAIAVVVGMTAVVANGVSYSDNFSTVLRAISAAYLTSPVKAEDAVGQDPLPKYLAKAKVSFADSARDGVSLNGRESAAAAEGEGKGAGVRSRLL